MKENFLISLNLKNKENINFEEYPFSVSSIGNLNKIIFHPNITYIVGENGSGKSTILEALAIHQGFNAEGGTKNFNFSTNKSHSILHRHLKIKRSTKMLKDGFFLRAESFFNFASNIDNLDSIPSNSPKIINSYGCKSLHEQSHGESFFSLMQNRFGDNGLYILDEPEAALSPSRQITMLALIHDLIQRGSQFIISTHSPILLSYPNALIYEINNEGYINKVLYEETDIYLNTTDFLSNYKKFHKKLKL